jgi:hypothetical protein
VIHFYIHWYLYIHNIKVSKHIYYSEWVSDCCLTPIERYFSYIMERTS